MDCIFCKIANGEIPTNMVYQDAQVAAFKDMNPQAPVHVLIVPKQHVENAAECVEKLPGVMEHMVFVAKTIAKDLGIAEDGYRMIMNTGKGAGQTVFHFHLHLLGGKQLSDKMD